MDTFDLSDLSPEDLQALSEQIKSHLGSAGPSGDSGDKVDKLCQALEFVVKELESMGQRVDNLQSLVMDDLFGTLEKQYKENARSMSISDLQSKYGSMVEPHMPALQALSPDSKIFDELYDMIEDAKQSGGEGWDEDTFVKEQLNDLADRLSKAGFKPEGSEPPVESEVSVAAVPEPKARVSEIVRKSALKMIK